MIGATQMNFGDGNRNITPLSTASLFSSSTSYAVDDYCFYDGVLYRCTTAHSGVWNASHFTAVTIADELADVKSDLSDLNAVEIYVQDTSLVINTLLTNGNEVSY